MHARCFLVSLHKKCAAWDLKVKDTPRKFEHRYPKLGHIWKFRWAFSKAHHFWLIYLCQFFEVFIYLPCQKKQLHGCLVEPPTVAALGSRLPFVVAVCAARQLGSWSSGERCSDDDAQSARRWMGEICLGRRCLLWWFFVNGLRLIFDLLMILNIWSFSCLFLRLCWLVLKSCLFRFDFLVYIIWRNSFSDWEDELNSSRISENLQKSLRQTDILLFQTIDRRPPVFGTTSQSVKSGNLFLSKQTLAALGIFISWTWILETCWNVKIDARLPW